MVSIKRSGVARAYTLDFHLPDGIVFGPLNSRARIWRTLWGSALQRDQKLGLRQPIFRSTGAPHRQV